MYKITKKSYTKKKRTSIALDPDLTKRLDKVLGDKKLSQFARDVLSKELDIIEMKNTIDFYKKLGESGQYHKIRQLEDDIKQLKRQHGGFEKELNYFKKEYEYEEKHEKHGALEEELAKGWKEEPELMKLLDREHKRTQDAYDVYRKKKFLEKYSEKEWNEFEKERKEAIDKYKKKKYKKLEKAKHTHHV